MRRFIIWLQAWYETLYIKFRQPELHRALTEPIDGDDFDEVGPPVDTKKPRVRKPYIRDKDRWYVVEGATDPSLYNDEIR